ncbi:unnamed protein product [Paramecium octaurelia]|uniref:Uncharacterized protein n=1 Tax=Paramecium octaurelia TaxID=43137 RepID=A0A8S1YI99_PAROT|nr:unnamed protein product [Paramecium octaurelia]
MGQCFDSCRESNSDRVSLESQNKVSIQEKVYDNYRNNFTTQMSELIEKEQMQKTDITHFKLLKTLGKGACGKVLLVKKKNKNTQYAMKIVSKQRAKEEYIQAERFILQHITHPFITKLHFAFQSDSKLYLIMDFCQGGELFFHLRRAYKFSEEQSKFYICEIIVALEHLHKNKILYRDLKPENILICSDGHIKLIDFGLSKILSDIKTRSHSVVGTPEYLAPEIYQDEGQGHDEQCDWWSLGALLYEMLTGAAPFYSVDRTLMFRNRLEKPLDIKPWFSEECKSLLQGLLNNDANQRLDVNQIKSHGFFRGIDWEGVVYKQLEPPIKLELKGPSDLQYFNRMFIDEPAIDSPESCRNEKKFENFSFDEDES